MTEAALRMTEAALRMTEAALGMADAKAPTVLSWPILKCLPTGPAFPEGN